MLVLTRKTGEEIVIGDNVHVMVVGIKGQTVRIGINAPKEVVVDRQEIHKKRTNSNGKRPTFAPTPPDLAIDAPFIAREIKPHL
jgi:carbon storage regulator